MPPWPTAASDFSRTRSTSEPGVRSQRRRERKSCRRISFEPMDRIAPTQRPRDRVVMYQKWRHLMFLHWAVAPAILRPLVPTELELDLFEGRAYVGLVPFTMKGVRPAGLPAVPALSNFHETNVRTYVHFQGRDPGVWFFSLDAANLIAVAAGPAILSPSLPSCADVSRVRTSRSSRRCSLDSLCRRTTMARDADRVVPDPWSGQRPG